MPIKSYSGKTLGVRIEPPPPPVSEGLSQLRPRQRPISSQNKAISVKGELQRQNKLISSERPFKILQNETKIIKIGQAVLEIFNFKDPDLDNFTRKNDRKTENVVFLEDLYRLKNNRLCDVRNDKCTYQQ